MTREELHAKAQLIKEGATADIWYEPLEWVWTRGEEEDQAQKQEDYIQKIRTAMSNIAEYIMVNL